MKNAYKPDRSVEDQLRHYFSGTLPEKFSEFGINKSDLKAFSAPDINKLKKNKTEIHFLVIINIGTHKKTFIMHRNIVVLNLIQRGTREPFLNMQV